MEKFRDSPFRSFTKTVVYRLATIIADLIIVYALTRRIDVTLGVTLFTNVASTVLYYVHERIWNHIGWGLRRVR